MKYFWLIATTPVRVEERNAIVMAPCEEVAVEAVNLGSDSIWAGYVSVREIHEEFVDGGLDREIVPHSDKASKILELF